MTKTKETNRKNGVDDNEKKLECVLCQSKFKYKPSLVSHIEKHKNEKFECKICFKLYSRSMALKTHILHIHSDSKSMFECLICFKSFHTYAVLQNHIKKLHAVLKNTIKCTCDKCGVQYYSKTHLQKHLSRSHLQPFKCLHEKCPKRFYNSTVRRKHHLLKHKENIEVSYSTSY